MTFNVQDPSMQTAPADRPQIRLGVYRWEPGSNVKNALRRVRRPTWPSR